MDVLALDHLEEALLASWALVSLGGLGLTVWLLIHCRRLTAGALDRLQSLEGAARKDRTTLGGALSTTTYTLGRLIERMNGFETWTIQRREMEEQKQFVEDKVVSFPPQPRPVEPHRLTRRFERRVQH